MVADDHEAALDGAADAVGRGDLVVYPTETVYGLGADALDPAAVVRVFEAKRRDRADPLSMAVPSVEAATAFVDSDAGTRAFMDAFLPGPVTVICRRRAAVPDVLTAGGDRVGIRVPDHPLALRLLERTVPLTATSANVSGRGSVTRVADLDPELDPAVAVVLDGGETGGTESTVVDPAAGEILRRGAMADDVAAWLAGR